MRVSMKTLFAGAAMILFSGFAAANGSTDESLVTAVQKGINLVFFLKLGAMAIFFLAGAYFAGTGIMDIAKSTKQGQNESPLIGIAKFGIGVALCVLPFVIGLTANTFLDGGSSQATENIQTQGDSF